MLDGTALRASSWLWGLRLVQVIFGFIALGIVGSNGADFKAMGCNLPANINIGIAVAAISLPFLLYLVSATGGKRQLLKMLPWNTWFQLAVDAFLLLLWLVTVADGGYKCNDVCSACSAGGALVDSGEGYTVTIGNFYCPCALESDFMKRSLGSSKALLSSAKLGLKVGAGIIMLLLFLATTVLDAYHVHKARKQYHHLPANTAGLAMQIPPLKTPYVNTTAVETPFLSSEEAYGYHATPGNQPSSYEPHAPPTFVPQHAPDNYYQYPRPQD